MQLGGKIDVGGCGYLPGYGPGVGQKFSITASAGAGHGGQGASDTTAKGGPGYGSIFTPVTHGSGGNSASGTGARGGGMIRIVSQGDLLVNGTLRANGGIPGTSGSGGAGGSILLQLNGTALSGGGTISADGTASSANGGGAGGHIAIIGYGSDNSFTGRVQAFGDKGFAYGAGGTIYRQSATVNPGAGVVSLNFSNRTTTCYVALPYATNNVEDLSKATIDMIYGARLLLQTNLTAQALNMATNTLLDLNGQTLTVRALSVNGVRFNPGGYTASASPQFADVPGTGQIQVLGNRQGVVMVIR